MPDLSRADYIRDQRVKERILARMKHIDANPPQPNTMTPEEQLEVNRSGIADVRAILTQQANRRNQGKLDL